MKEQVSVDKEVKVVNYRAMEESEYERLKRLDESVTNKLVEYKNALTGIDAVTISLSTEDKELIIDDINNNIRLLESLYK